ncbi:MAG: branched-chain amino acid ABC transporter permease [Peptococcaceae bacterium]|nr:branched-chain amino acid ABC transporter permease [Peptococcaceae bacterium]
MQERRRERIDRGVKVRADSIYAVSSMKEIMYLLGPRLALVLILLLLPLVIPLYWKKVIIITAIYALLSLSFGFLSNYVGLVNLGSALFVGAGGYLSGLLNAHLGWPLIVTVPVATVTGALFCTLLLLPCLPLRGIYFAIVSFTYPLIAVKLIAAVGAFGGTDGITGLTMLPTSLTTIYTILIITLAVMFGLSRLVDTEDIGLVFRGVKDNEQAIKASALNLTWYKTVAVFISALIGNFAGAYLAHLYGWVGMSLLSTDFSILPLAASVVGGSGTLYGPLIGTFILVPMSEALRQFGTLRIVFYASVMVLFVVFWTEGLMNFLRRRYEQFERWVRV